MKEKLPNTPNLLKDKKTLTFPALASLTLAACGGGGGGGALITPPAPTNKAPTTAGTTTLTLDEDSTDMALAITSPSDADGDSLTITVTGLPTGGTLTTADGISKCIIIDIGCSKTSHIRVVFFNVYIRA